MSQKKLRRYLAVVISLVTVYILILQTFMYRYSHMELPSHADYLIVLGARVKGEAPSLSLRYRIDRAAQYLEDNPQTIAIVSGGKGNGENMSEAEVMKLELIEYGIPEHRILMEDKSTSTEENIAFSKTFIPAKAKKGLIVTNDYHVYRAVSVARKAGLSVQGLAADTPKRALIQSYIREYVALTVYFIKGRM
ncbi:YdcF family protein [Ectobacillus funiculus]|uniref:YdcF family protein n=1 Tax=Ectobacillus funiculus TaxID=137993 RepID=UPI00397D34D2